MNHSISVLLDALITEESRLQTLNDSGIDSVTTSKLYERCKERIDELMKALKILEEHQKGTP